MKQTKRLKHILPTGTISHIIVDGDKPQILLLLNELRVEVSRQYKERGQILIELWTQYYGAIQQEHQQMLDIKNMFIQELLHQLAHIKSLMAAKDKDLLEQVNEVKICMLDSLHTIGGQIQEY